MSRKRFFWDVFCYGLIGSYLLTGCSAPKKAIDFYDDNVKKEVNSETVDYKYEELLSGSDVEVSVFGQDYYTYQNGRQKEYVSIITNNFLPHYSWETKFIQNFGLLYYAYVSNDGYYFADKYGNYFKAFNECNIDNLSFEYKKAVVATDCYPFTKIFHGFYNKKELTTVSYGQFKYSNIDETNATFYTSDYVFKSEYDYSYNFSYTVKDFDASCFKDVGIGVKNSMKKGNKKYSVMLDKEASYLNYDTNVVYDEKQHNHLSLLDLNKKDSKCIETYHFGKDGQKTLAYYEEEVKNFFDNDFNIYRGEKRFKGRYEYYNGVSKIEKNEYKCNLIPIYQNSLKSKDNESIFLVGYTFDKEGNLSNKIYGVEFDEKHGFSEPISDVKFVDKLQSTYKYNGEVFEENEDVELKALSKDFCIQYDKDEGLKFFKGNSNQVFNGKLVHFWTAKINNNYFFVKKDGTINNVYRLSVDQNKITRFAEIKGEVLDPYNPIYRTCFDDIYVGDTFLGPSLPNDKVINSTYLYKENGRSYIVYLLKLGANFMRLEFSNLLNIVY